MDWIGFMGCRKDDDEIFCIKWLGIKFVWFERIDKVNFLKIE